VSGEFKPDHRLAARAVCIVHSPEGFRLLIFCLFKSEDTP
jgi:hypothetical protein